MEADQFEKNQKQESVRREDAGEVDCDYLRRIVHGGLHVMRKVPRWF